MKNIIVITELQAVLAPSRHVLSPWQVTPFTPACARPLAATLRRLRMRNSLPQKTV